MKPQQLWATSTKLVMFPEESKAWSNEEKNGYTSHGKNNIELNMREWLDKRLQNHNSVSCDND